MTVEVSQDGKDLIITVPMSMTPPPSASGKTRIVCSSGGFKQANAVHPSTKRPMAINLTVTIPN